MNFRHWLLSLGVVICAAPLAFAARPAEAKTSCAEKELARMDCRLQEQSFNLRLLAKTIAWSDGEWHVVNEMPLKGEAVEWEKAGFELLGGWPILQLWLWEKGEGELQVQSLHWFVYAAEDRKMALLADGVVRKRRLKEAEAILKPGAKSVKPKYLYDAWEKFDLSLLKNGDLDWHLADQKKTFAKKQVSHGL